MTVVDTAVSRFAGFDPAETNLGSSFLPAYASQCEDVKQASTFPRI